MAYEFDTERQEWVNNYAAGKETYTRAEVYAKLKEWVESHNPEFAWNWADWRGVKKEMDNCCILSHAFNLEALLNLF